MSTLNKLMDGYNPHKALMEQTKGLVNKWSPTGLLEGLNGETETHGMSILLENQARQLIDESSRTGTSANSEEWSGVALPLVRRVFGEIAAKDFVSVQPMNLPSGLVFYLNFKYGTAQAGFTSGGNIHGTTEVAGDASGGLYGAGKFGYSINDLSSSVLQTGSGVGAGSNTVTSGQFSTGSVSWADVDFEPDLSASAATGYLADDGLMKITVDADDDLSGFDAEGVRAFSISGSGFDEYFPAHTSVNAGETEVSFIVKKSVAAAPASIVVTYHKQASTDYNRTDFEATAGSISENPEGDIDIPELDIALKSIPIIAKTRKLKAVWTPELAQDLNAYHSVDAEAELTSLLSEYISMEIDLEILDMLKANASAKTENWSARVGYEYNSSTTIFEEQSGASNAYTKGEWFQTLGNKIQSVSNAIHQKTLRGGANFMVVSPTVATILESIPGFAADSDGDAAKMNYAFGVQKVGAINDRQQVYKNPYMTANQILLGYRGSQFLEAGAVFAPYIPLIMTPLVYDPDTFVPRKGLLTRYAKKIVRPEFYGKIEINGLNTL